MIKDSSQNPEPDDNETPSKSMAHIEAALAAEENVDDPWSWEPPEAEELAALFPDFEIQQLLGRGGMGAVFKAMQKNLHREVAIKLLPPEIAKADESFAERFLHEARAMAQLNHQNIVTIYDFGETSAGHYYFLMEFVDGTDFHQLIHTGKLDHVGALNAMSQICDALSYAHAHGYIHRDIKPANIFINREGVIKVGDFGLAKIAGDSEIATSNPNQQQMVDPGLTMVGQVMGTPDYSSPEQIDGHQVDHRADIYSLGVLLYEMLTREVPRGYFKPASDLVGSDERLDLVVNKAMEYAPDDRYSSVKELRAAVDEVRKGPAPEPEPAAAGPKFVFNETSRVEAKAPTEIKAAAKKKIAQKKAKSSMALWLVVGGVLVVGVVAVLGVILSGGKDPTPPPIANPSTPVEPPPSTPSTNGSEIPLPKPTFDPVMLTNAGLGDPENVSEHLAGIIGDNRLSHWRAPQAAAFHPTKPVLASGGMNRELRLWDTNTGELLEYRHSRVSDIRALAFNRDGTILAGGEGGALVLREFPSLEVIARLNHPSAIEVIKFVPDSDEILTGCNDNRVRVFDIRTREELWISEPHPVDVRAIDFDKARGRFAYAGLGGPPRGDMDRKVVIRDYETKQLVREIYGHDQAIDSVAFTPDGMRIATGGKKAFRVWDVESGEQVAEILKPNERDDRPVVTMTPSGAAIFAFHKAVHDTSEIPIRVWSPNGESRTAEGSGHVRQITSLTMHPRGHLLASTSNDHSVQLWRVGTEDPPSLTPAFNLGATGDVRGLAISPDGKHVFYGGVDYRVHVWDRGIQKELMQLRIPEGRSRIMDLEFSADGSRIAAAHGIFWPPTGTGDVHVWDAKSGKLLVEGLPDFKSNGGPSSEVAFHPKNSDILAVANCSFYNKVGLVIYDIGRGEIIHQLNKTAQNHGFPEPIEFSPDGQFLVMGKANKRLVIWRTADWKHHKIVEDAHGREVKALSFSPDGKTMASGSYTGTVKLWNTQTWETIWESPFSPRGILSLDFHPDGDLLACTNNAGTVTILNPETGRPIDSLRVGPRLGDVYRVRFTPDGRQLLAANYDGTIHVFNVDPAWSQPLPEIAAKETPAPVAAVSPVLWLRADQGVDTDSTGRVKRWRSLAGGLDAIQPTPHRKPEFIADGFNGQPVVRFDGIEDHLIINDQVISSQEFSILGVGQSVEGGRLFSNWRREGQRKETVYLGLAPNLTVEFTEIFRNAGRHNQPDSPFSLFAVNRSDSAATYYNGVKAGLRASQLPNRDLDPPYKIGALDPDWNGKWNGDIAEIIVVDRALSRSELADLQEYFVERYDLQPALPLAETGGRQPGEEMANSLGMQLNWIPGRSAGGDAEPGYWAGKYEVKQSEFETLMGFNPSVNEESTGDHPVTMMTWRLALEFCRKLTERDRAAGKLPEGYAYTLPTQEQWEFACRAGFDTWFCFGDSLEELRKFGNYRDGGRDDGFAETAPTGSYRPNAWGLHDMHGNVWEFGRGRWTLLGGSFMDEHFRCGSSRMLIWNDRQPQTNIGLRVFLLPKEQDESLYPIQQDTAFFAEDSFGGHYYRFFANSMITWHEARARCQEMGGYLVVPTSDEEVDFLQRLASRRTHWVGAREPTDGNWEWITGEDFDPSFVWTRRGEPNNLRGTQDWGEMRLGWPFDDNQAHAPTQGFVCEWEDPRIALAFDRSQEAKGRSVALMVFEHMDSEASVIKNGELVPPAFMSRGHIHLYSFRWKPEDELILSSSTRDQRLGYLMFDARTREVLDWSNYRSVDADSATAVQLKKEPGLAAAKDFEHRIEGLFQLRMPRDWSHIWSAADDAETLRIRIKQRPTPAETSLAELLATDPGTQQLLMSINGQKAPDSVTLTADRFGALNNALYFDGKESFTELKQGDPLSIGADHQFTVSLWFRSDSLRGQGTRLLSTAGPGWDSGFSVGYSQGANQIHFQLSDGKGEEGRLIRSRTWTRGQRKWTHFAAVVDGVWMTIYIDGVREAVLHIGGEGEVAPSTRPFLGTGIDNKPENRFHGAIDDVKVWSRPLSDSEVRFEARNR